MHILDHLTIQQPVDVMRESRQARRLMLRHCTRTRTDLSCLGANLNSDVQPGQGSCSLELNRV